MAYTILVADCYIYIMAYTPKLVSLQRCDLQCSLQPRSVSRPIALISPDCALGMRRPKIIRAQHCRRTPNSGSYGALFMHMPILITIPHSLPPSIHPSIHPSIQTLYPCMHPPIQPASHIRKIAHLPQLARGPHFRSGQRARSHFFRDPKTSGVI